MLPLQIIAFVLIGLALGAAVPFLIRLTPEITPDPEGLADSDTEPVDDTAAAKVDQSTRRGASRGIEADSDDPEVPAELVDLIVEMERESLKPSPGRGRPGDDGPTFDEISRHQMLAPLAIFYCGVLAAAAAYRLDFSWQAFPWLTALPFLVALGVIDQLRFLLPTSLIARAYLFTAPAIAAAIATDFSGDKVFDVGAGWLVFTTVFFLAWFIKPDGLGYGDVRLSGLLGALLGLGGISYALVGVLVVMFSGVIGAGAIMVLRRGAVAPFGPWMIVGTLVTLFAGQQIAVAIYGPY